MNDDAPSEGMRDVPSGVIREERASLHSNDLRKALQREVQALLALAAMRGVGHKTLFEIAEYGNRFSDVLEHGPVVVGNLFRQIARRGGPEATSWRSQREEARSRAAETQDLLDQLQVALILRDDPRFPIRLLNLARPPHWLFVQGSIARLSDATVTIVGTRKPSADGLFLVSYVGACLADWSVPTVSGLAVGIDQLAHERSLRAGVPTIALLGTGVLEDYPKGSGRLRDRILAAGGSIVTEYLPHTSYSAENFVQRNRLQAALGSVVLPVEWNRRSGTAHTVRFASELKRPIACLRLPDWPSDRVMLEPGLGQETGAIFTVPREHVEFDQFVRSAIGKPSSTSDEQLSLFD